MKNMTFRKSLTAAAVAASLGFPALAVAQDAQQNAETEQAEEQIERIVTTGSRIARPELSQAAPILSLGEEDIEKFGSPDLGQILAELPAVGATNTLIGNRESSASAGISAADLRRLGANRTLVLVDGKRHVAGSPGSASVDLSTIPSGMIERIEIMTGGASAIYGSDAVSGVINVILKKDYEGFEISGQAAGSTEGVGARTHEFTFLGGGDFMNGRGNATFYAGMNRIQETMANDVRQFNSWGTILNPEDTGRLDGIPDRIYAENVGSQYLSGGGVLHGDQFYGFFPDGSWQVQPTPAGKNSALFWEFPDGCETCAFTEDYVNLQPSVNRVNVGSSMNFEMSDSARFYTDFKYTQADIEQQYQPSFTQDIKINVEDNPYLDEGLRENLLAADVQEASFWKFFEDWGNRTADNRRELFRFNAGVDGALDLAGNYLQYDVYYGYGETRNRRQTLRSKIPGNVLAAVDTIEDGDGNIVCRDPDAGSVNTGGECVPYNPFGDQASEAAVNFMSADVTRQDKITQEYAGASFVTDTGNFFSLQGGPVDVAFGFEWREETSETITDEFTRRGLTANAATPNEYGEYDVTESFVELNLPILAGLDFAEELSLDMAYRSADYSHAGSADAWKLGVMYAPIKDLRFRGTVGVAVRAPNVAEAFSPRSPGFANVTDPCDETRIENDPNRAANCAALGIPENFQSETNASIDSISGGNPNLEAEESDSITYGIVWTPSFIENFSLTLDYYDIEIDDAITLIASQTVINNCVDSESGINNTFCDQVTRGEDNQLTAVESGYLNAASLKTSGYEMEINYQTELGQFDLPGSLSTSLFINHLDEFVEYPFQDKPTQDEVETGEVGDPEWQFRFSANYRLDDLNVSWTTRFLDRSALYDVTPRRESYENIGPAYVGSITTHDIAVGYHVTDELRVSGGIRNMFDKVPPGYVENALYDLTGRRAYVNFTYSF